ncbi:bestrophin-like domain [Dyella flagellata]|uniref:DUF4239 domain-containing protein n=1 Tax=Dyella flagellata TaxID=1867833 RepID=A0ABQ5X7T4_9GAMM|nr:DUF4239 domain-containing protein [Dyella flagellata]GLQ86608.1 hypothetical protein GCM10007898_01740 [Dyella flagellata]
MMLYLLDHPVDLFVMVVVVLLLAHEFGFRLRAWAKNRDDNDWEKEVHQARNQVGLLLSLLIGFTLSMALNRFDERKQLVIDEANAIGTAYLRAGMQAESMRSDAQELLRDYVDARLAIFGRTTEIDEHGVEVKRARQIQDQLWKQATSAAQQTPTPIVGLYVSALNDVIDLDAKRVAARRNRVPPDIWALMTVLAVVTSLIIGYGQRRRAALLTFVPVFTVAISMSLIADLDSPVHGLIQVSQQSMQLLSDDLHKQFSAQLNQE